MDGNKTQTPRWITSIKYIYFTISYTGKHKSKILDRFTGAPSRRSYYVCVTSYIDMK